MRIHRLFLVALAFSPLPFLIPDAIARDLTFEARVKAQRAIEQVYWNHRIWPKENRGAKPPLDAVLSDAQIRARVENYLKKSNALEELWGRPLTAQQLQAEMERVAARTRSPELLREMFAALDNDPFLIAETLARQTLVDRLIRGWYARDERFHGDVRRRAEAALARASDVGQLRALGAAYDETTLRLRRPGEEPARKKQGEVVFDEEDWREWLGGPAGGLGVGARPAHGMKVPPDGESVSTYLERLALMATGQLIEEDGAFLVTTVLRKEHDSLTMATASWPKTTFEAWWEGRSALMSGVVAPAGREFAGAAVTPPSACEPDTWTAIPMSGAPPGRVGHTAVWTGSEMIVWGGGNAFGDFSDGWRYSPLTDTWLAIPGLLGPRSDHTAVWTGSEMIVFGGRDATGPLNDGGRYNPTTDSWLPTTSSGVPSGRFYHTALWTGGEMVIWGGDDASGVIGDGARYDPSTDGWEAIAVSGAPAPRDLPAAVWTGSQMIVWGGYGETYDPLGDGGRYDPSSDGWEAVPTDGAPAARYGLTGVWTGSEMILWGGWGLHGYLADGMRYSPSTDTWSAMSESPGSRAGHTAVWTGNEMVVWGGDSYGLLGDGARYIPLSDSWEATAIGGAPGPRVGATALWTGKEMMIWGGVGSSMDFFGDGGLYCVTACVTPAPWYQDHDGDGYGTTSVELFACDQPVGFVATSTDCDDTSAEIHPGAVDLCDGGDEDCDGTIDDDDSDQDDVTICEDNCPSSTNPAQDDQDGDGAGDVCDCAPMDNGSFNHPGALLLTLPADGSGVMWTNHGVATQYDVLKGSVREFPVGSGSSEVCFGTQVLGTSIADGTSPLLGEGFWYLVRGENSCGVGTYGTTSAGTSRTSNACP